MPCSTRSLSLLCACAALITVSFAEHDSASSTSPDRNSPKSSKSSKSPKSPKSPDNNDNAATFTLVYEYSAQEVQVLGDSYGNVLLPGMSYNGVKAYQISFPSLWQANKKGRNVKAKASKTADQSALLYIPDSPANSSCLEVGVFFHGTTISGARTPFNALSSCQQGQFASFSVPCVPKFSPIPTIAGLFLTSIGGTVSIGIDGTNYGIHGDYGGTYPYLVADQYGIAAFSALPAVASFLGDEFDATLNKQFITGGYSEGGYAAVSVHKGSQNDRFKGNKFTVAASFSGAGPLDLEGDVLCNDQGAQIATYVALYAVSYADFYNIDILNPATEAAARKAINGLESDEDAEGSLREATGNQPDTIYSAKARAEIAAYCQNRKTRGHSGKQKKDTKLLRTIRSNNLVEGWTPQDNSVSLCHYVGDEVVPLSATQSFVDAFPDAITVNSMIPVLPAPHTMCDSHSSCGVLCGGQLFDGALMKFMMLAQTCGAETY